MTEAAHPKPTLSLKACANSPPYTMSFLGTQPRSTQVPPAPPATSEDLRANGISHTAALTPAAPACGVSMVREEVLHQLQEAAVQEACRNGCDDAVARKGLGRQAIGTPVLIELPDNFGRKELALVGVKALQMCEAPQLPSLCADNA